MRLYAFLLPASLLLASTGGAAEPVVLGDRFELFADDALVASHQGLERVVQQPVPGEVVLTMDAPWEGNTSAYYTLFQDGDLYRMYYRASAADPKTKKSLRGEVTCYAESQDGLHWVRPELGVHEFQGSKANNILLTGEGTHNFTPFRDENPAATPDARYKAMSGSFKKGLLPWGSSDGIHWRKLSATPVITDGAFDSQNLAFWDPVRGEYRAYWRYFGNKVRAIRTAVSKDFLTWERQADLAYGDAPVQHLYTNAIRPYFRAPHLFIGFPTRFLPNEGERVEPVFMVGRDGVNFLRYDEAVVPEDAPADRKGNRSNYMTNALLSLPGEPGKLSVYATEAYYGPVPGRVRRFTYRVDGFVALQAGSATGILETVPVTFKGSHLTLNYKARENGSVRVELSGADGSPLPGFSIAESQPLTGDEVKATVRWQSGHDVAGLTGQPIVVRIEAKHAELYSMRFH